MRNRSQKPILAHAGTDLLRCPASGESLERKTGHLVTRDGKHRYRLKESGIACFAETPSSESTLKQQAHYDHIAQEFLRNLGFSFAREYAAYLDHEFCRMFAGETLGDVAEICCGRGEAFLLLRDRISRGIGVDISLSMLNSAVKEHAGYVQLLFVQGDATKLPLKSAAFDRVVMLGGIHHVPDREKLFSEIFRILRPGGKFCWREPVSDFFLWRWIRAAIYRLSPYLDHETERPLRYKETIPILEKVGLRLNSWRTYGFIGFCLFANSDVLVFNRLFRYFPGILSMTRVAIRVDDWLARQFPRSGLQVIGEAEKPDPGRSR